MLPIPRAQSSHMPSGPRMGLGVFHWILFYPCPPTTSPPCWSVLTKGGRHIEPFRGNMARRVPVGLAMGRTDSGIFSLELNQIWAFQL